MKHIISEQRIFANEKGAAEMILAGLKFCRHRILRSIARLEWSALAMLVGGHMAVTYLGLQAAGETHLTEPVTFSYYYFTTASTIGYGDLSPVTAAGQAFAFAWIFPGALSFYMVLLAKVTQSVTSAWRKRMDGHGDFSAEVGRTVIVGYMPCATQRVLRDLLAGGLSAQDVILIATRKPEFDYEEIDFVLTEDLARAEDLVRGGVGSAKNVLVMGPTDDATFTAAMAVSHVAAGAHIVAGLECETRAALLEAHSSVVPVISQPPEVVASEVLDPGIGQVLSVLGAASTDVTAFSVTPEAGPLDAGLVHAVFRQLGMTFLGVQCGKTGLKLNPPDATDVTGYPLYYIAADRVNHNAFRGAVCRQKTLRQASQDRAA